jgi:hypothetical protein
MTNTTDKHKLIKIKKLIKAKRYGDARYHLIAIDHPTAHRWLQKLNDIDPDYKAKTILPIKSIVFFSVLIVVCVWLLIVGGADVNTGISIGVFMFIAFLLFMSVWTRIAL